MLFTQDEDLLAEAARRQRTGQPFLGLIYVHQRKLGIGDRIRKLQLFNDLYELADMANRVEYLSST